MMRRWSLRTLFVFFTIICLLCGRAMFVVQWVNTCKQFCTDVSFRQQKPRIESKTFIVVVPRKTGEGTIQKRKRHKIAVESQSKPLLAFLAGDQIEALSIPAASVDKESTSALCKMKSLKYIVVLGDNPDLNAVSHLRSSLPGVQVEDNEEIVDSTAFDVELSPTTQAQALLAK